MPLYEPQSIYEVDYIPMFDDGSCAVPQARLCDAIAIVDASPVSGGVIARHETITEYYMYIKKEGVSVK